MYKLTPYYFPGADSDWDVILVFSGGRRAMLKCSSKFELDNTARVSGTEGCIEVSLVIY